MTLPSPATLLRHHQPALVVGRLEAFDGGRLSCRSRDDGPFDWPRMLEGAAQTAGILLGLQASGFDDTSLVAEYRGVTVHAATHPGPLRFTATLGRRLFRFWRCPVTVHDLAGTLLLKGQVTLVQGDRR